MVDKMEREAIVYQILDKDNWEVIDQIDSFLYVYDKMPLRERTVIDFRMTGMKANQISAVMNISVSTVRVHLHNAKKKILNALY